MVLWHSEDLVVHTTAVTFGFKNTAEIDAAIDRMNRVMNT